MSKRSIWIYTTVALAGCVGGATFAMWSSNDSLNEAVVSNSQHNISPYAQQPGHSGNAKNPLPVTHSLDLRLSDPLSLSGSSGLAPPSSSKAYAAQQPAHTQPNNSAPKKAKRSSLDLKLPTHEQPHALVKADAEDAPTLPESTTVENAAALDLQPKKVVAPHVKSYSLFNPEYGLRGFMTQGWLNQHFGVQGGLGLNDDKRIKTDNSFRDDIAVGMGVVLAF